MNQLRRLAALLAFALTGTSAIAIASSAHPAIQGRVTRRWHTTVICGFVENTRAICWQRSPCR